MHVYIRLGWVKLKQFANLSGVSEEASKKRMLNVSYPAWRVGAGMIKKLHDGYYVNWEVYQQWLEDQPAA